LPIKIRASAIISFRKTLNSRLRIPGKHDIKEQQKTVTLGTAHEGINIRVQNVCNGK